MLAAGIAMRPSLAFANNFETKRPPLAYRKFTSEAVEATIVGMKKKLPTLNLPGFLKIVFLIL